MTVRVGVLSAAHTHSDAYAAALDDIEHAELVAVADQDDERGQAFADRHEISYGTRESVLQRADAAIVTAANVDHREWTTAAADAGVDVLCEKPLATTTEDARAMVRAAEQAGVALGVAMPVRFSEPARRAKAAVEGGEIGDLQAVVGTNLLTTISGGTWITDPAQSGGGAIMDHTVHVVDLVRWITDQEVAEVYTETGTRFTDIPAEDVAVLSMALDDGTPLTHDGSWRQPESWDFWGDVTLRLIGTEGVLEVDCFDQTIAQTTESGIESVFWGSDINEGLLRDFVTAVSAGEQPAILGREGVREVSVIEAAYESAETGRPVAPDYDGPPRSPDRSGVE